MRLLDFLCFFVVVITSIFFSYDAYQNRDYNWDLPGYLGVYYKNQFPEDKVKVHQLVYSQIQKESSPDVFFKVMGLDEPTKATHSFATNSEAFDQQLPYYEIKFLYNAVICFLSQFGLSISLSAQLPNFIFYFLSSVLLFFIFYEIFYKKSILAALFTLVLISLPFFRVIAISCTPDSFAIFMLLYFMFSVIKKYSNFYLFLILVFLVLIRPDYIIFGVTYFFAVVMYQFLKKRSIDYQQVIFMLVLLAVYFGILRLYQYPGWKSVFYDSFIHRRNFISTEPAIFSLKKYVEITLNALIYMKKVNLVAIVFTTISWFYARNSWDKIVAILLFINLQLKFLTFPAAGEYRFFVGFLLIITIWSIYLLVKNNFVISNYFHKKIT